MAKKNNNRKSGLESALNALNKIEITEVVEMNKELVVCVDCGVELLEGEVVEVMGKMICEKCFDVMNSELENLNKNDKEVVEMVENKVVDIKGLVDVSDIVAYDDIEVPTYTVEKLDITEMVVAHECTYCEDAEDCSECKVNEVNEDITIVEELAEEEIVDVDALREAHCEQVLEAMEELSEVKEDCIKVSNCYSSNDKPCDVMVNEFKKYKQLVAVKKAKMDTAIKGAIKYGADNVVEGIKTNITASQVKAFIGNYTCIVGVKPSEKELNDIKKLNGSQMYYIEKTFDIARRKVREHNFNKMMAKKNA